MHLVLYLSPRLALGAPTCSLVASPSLRNKGGTLWYKIILDTAARNI